MSQLKNTEASKRRQTEPKSINKSKLQTLSLLSKSIMIMWAIEKDINNCRIYLRYRMPIYKIYKNETMAIQLKKVQRLYQLREECDRHIVHIRCSHSEDIFGKMEWTNMEKHLNERKPQELRCADDVPD